MNRIYTKEDVREILEEFGEIGGMSASEIPIIISSRMERTFGAFSFKFDSSGKAVPLSFKFSLKLLSGDFDYEVVRSTIGHEYAHFLVTMRDNINHNHDMVFKEACRILGISDRTRFIGDVEEKVKKGYILSCRKCGKVVAKRRREDMAFRIRSHYRSACCNEKMDIRKTVY